MIFTIKFDWISSWPGKKRKTFLLLRNVGEKNSFLGIQVLDKPLFQTYTFWAALTLCTGAGRAPACVFWLELHRYQDAFEQFQSVVIKKKKREGMND